MHAFVPLLNAGPESIWCFLSEFVYFIVTLLYCFALCLQVCYFLIFQIIFQEVLKAFATDTTVFPEHCSDYRLVITSVSSDYTGAP